MLGKNKLNTYPEFMDTIHTSIPIRLKYEISIDVSQKHKHRQFHLVLT